MLTIVLSDIHANHVALEAVLADLAGKSIDRFICLGDVATDGPRPREVLQRLREHNATVIMGNADHLLLHPPQQPLPPSPTRPVLAWPNPINRWCSAQLTDDDRGYVAAFLPPTAMQLNEELSIYCYHGSPRSWSDNILAATPIEQVEDWLADVTTTICAGGHTHEPMLRRVGQKTVINPGSVGAAFDRRYLPGELRVLPWADYATIETNVQYPTISFRRVRIDLDALAADVHASGMPHADDWLAMWRSWRLET